MKKQLATSLGLCLGLALAACTPDVTAYTQTEAPKQIHVDFVHLSHVVAFAPGKADLAKGEAEKLDAFLSSAQIGGQDHVYLEPANESKLTASRIGRVSREMTKHRVGAETLPAGGVIPADRMRIVVERYVATPPDCPNWSSPAYGDHSNQPTSNFGCTDATNFSMMVADPRDLVVGHSMGPAEGDIALAPVTRYRQGKPRALIGQGSAAGASAQTGGASGGGGVGIGTEAGGGGGAAQ